MSIFISNYHDVLSKIIILFLIIFFIMVLSIFCNKNSPIIVEPLSMRIESENGVIVKYDMISGFMSIGNISKTHAQTLIDFETNFTNIPKQVMDDYILLVKEVQKRGYKLR